MRQAANLKENRWADILCGSLQTNLGMPNRRGESSVSVPRVDFLIPTDK